jgi:hypothetical protein
MITIFLLWAICVAQTASAYIDPGTTSVVFGAVGYVIAGAAAFFAIIFHPVKILYRKIFKKDQAETADAELPATPADDPK